MSSRKKAFTLIELLVVIAIIGILATISVLALNNARAKSRDAKRAGDMKQIQTALELFFNDRQRYPNVQEWNTGKLFSTTTNSTSTYMQIIPLAPTPSDGSCTNGQNSIAYNSTPDGSSYAISFCLGNTTGSLTPGPKCLTPGGILDRECFECGDQVGLTTVAGHACNEGTPDYDQCSYTTVKIGNQCWFKENLNIGAIVTGTTTQANNSILEKYCYNNNSNNCQVKGGLYQWNEAMQYSLVEGIPGICPTGWHIPSDGEQNVLDQFLNDTSCDANRVGMGCDNAGTKLAAGGSSGFEALPSGYRHTSGSFLALATNSYFWSSSYYAPYHRYRGIVAGATFVNRYYNSDYGYSVRCLKD